MPSERLTITAKDSEPSRYARTIAMNEGRWKLKGGLRD
jgi:hypothetical protein